MKIKIIFLTISMILGSSCATVSALFERGGTKFTIEVKPMDANAEGMTDEAAKVLESRLNAIGINNRITKTQANRVEVLAYGKPDVERIRKFLLATSKLELAKVSGESFQTYPTREAAIQSLGGEGPPNRRVLSYTELDDQKEGARKWIIVEDPPVIDGRTIRDASAYSQTGSNLNDYQIAFKLKPEGAAKFGDWTGKNIGKYLAIVLNDEVKSAPVIKGQIFDSGQIDGKFTKASAEDLALILKSRYLPATLTLIDESTFE
jgi:preprotein translocase subunit SecD